MSCFVLAACSAPQPTSDAGVDAGPSRTWDCTATTASPEYLKEVGCLTDYTALASVPVSASIPGARSVKVVLDTADSNALYFQNSVLYQVHYEFASTHLSGGALPVVPSLSSFNTTEYFSPERRFILAAVSYYEGPQVFALEFSPYDTASATMMQTLFDAVKAHAYFGDKLVFHPTSDAVALEAKKASFPIMTTDDLYEGIDYQPLTLSTGVGRLRFSTAAAVSATPPSSQDLLVLDEAPNDISVVRGLITQTFQTPLSHINVLSANRGTPNMGLKGALTNATLRALDGKLVKLTVGALEWSAVEVTQAEAEAFWTAHAPTPVVLPALDLVPTGIVDVQDCTPDPTDGGTLRNAIKESARAYGGKAAQYSILKRIGDDKVPVKPAFVVPMKHYDDFMRDNGLYTLVQGYLADSSFRTDSAVRVQKLAELNAAIMQGTVRQELIDAILAKAATANFAGKKLRFRTSTNSEDLDGFPCAGCYESHTGDPTNVPDVLDAIRQTYASAWSFRTFEERNFYGIDQFSVGMALLIHTNYPSEEANGVAVTANPFDAAGIDPAFYVNVQSGGDAEVVAPPPGVTSDQFLYYFSQPNQPITFLAHSNLIAPNTTVLTTTQTYQLGKALDAIHKRFSAAYGPAAGNLGWYAMDCEFKFDDDATPGNATLYIKQARPYPGRGQ
ncbi:MAG: PEP/pyruvate-binding domain-containing protein [Archangium sp.]